MPVARRLSIHGRVQGVYYRGWTVETALRLGLAGWVRNRSDGTVEAVVQGDEVAIERFVELAREGPAAARVERVDTSDAAVEDGLAGFRQKATL
jgi:acylphosphatase